MKEKPEANEDQTATAANFDARVDEETFQMQTGQLVCDARDLILQLFKDRPKPWVQLTEEEQGDIAAGVERFSEGMVGAIVALVAAKGQHTISAVLEKFTYKGGAAQILLKSVGGPELATDLAKFDAQAVLIVSADASEFYGVRPPEIMPTSPELFNEEEPGAGEAEEDLAEAAE